MADKEIKFSIVTDTSGVNKNLDDTGKKVEDIGKKAEGTKKGFSGMGNAIKGVGTALKAAGIGLVLSLLAALFSLLKENQAVLDFINKATKTMAILFNQLMEAVKPLGESLKGVFDDPKQAVIDLWETIKTNLLNRLTGIVDSFKFLGKTIKAALDLDWDGVKEGAAGLGESLLQVTTGIDDLPSKMKKFGEAVVETFTTATQAADDYIERQNQLKINEAELNKFIAKNKATIEELKLVREDETASIEDRIAAAEQINKLIAEEEARAIALQEEKIALMQADLDLTQTSVQDLVDIKNAEAQLDNLRAQAFTNQKENQKKIQSLRKQDAADKQAIIDKENEDAEKQIQAELDRFYAFRDRKKALEAKWRVDDATTLQEQQDAELENEKIRFEDYKKTLGDNQAEIELAEEEHQRRMDEIKGVYRVKVQKTEEEKLKDELNRIAEKFEYAKQVMDIYSAYLDQQMEKELKAAEGNEKRQEQIRKKYGEKKKQAAIISAIIDTAQGVIKAIAQNPPPSPIGIISGVLVGAMGAVQIATISQQQFAKGGVLNGPSHAQGGILTPYGELEGGEGVINTASMSNPSLRNMASIANVAGGGNDFSTGDGSVSLSSGSIAAIVGGINNKKVYVSEQDITETQNKVKVVETEATL